MKTVNSYIKKYFPLIESIEDYDREMFRGDLVAGFTVGVMLIPQGMAYALIAGLPPEYGLYAALVPLVVYAFMGTSRHLSVGPTALVSLLVAAAVSPLAETPEEYIYLSIILGFMVGIIQLIFGLSKMGFIVNLVSNPVLSGFVSAAAIIIGLSQLHHLFGLESVSGGLHEVLYGILIQISDFQLITFAIGLLSIAIIFILKKRYPIIPGPMTVMIIGIIIVYLYGLDQNGVPIVGNIENGLPALYFPELNVNTILVLLPMSMAIALVSLMESNAIAKVIEKRDKSYEIDSDQELVALGTAKIVGAFFQSYPASGSFSRSAVNYSSGAKTGIASLISALTVGLTLLLLTPVFYYLPNAVLAAIIMVSVFGLIEFDQFKKLWKLGHYDRYMLLATFAGTLFIGIKEGLLLGITLSVIMLLYRSARPNYSVIGKIPGTTIYRNVSRYKTEQKPNYLIFRFDAPLHFANAVYFKTRVEELMHEHPETKCLILDLNGVNEMDSTGLDVLFEIIDNLRKENIDVKLAQVKSTVRDIIVKKVNADKVPEFFMRIEDAVKSSSRKSDSEKMSDEEFQIYKDTH